MSKTTTAIDYETTIYFAHDGTTHTAIIIVWSEVTRVLGEEHTGSFDQDAILVAALVAAGAPEWVDGSDGWADAAGWGVIGPEIESDDE